MGTATTCENGITHAIVSMGETSRVYFIPIHEEEETGITPTPHPNERASDGGSDCMDGASAHCALALISIRGIVRTGWKPYYIPRMAHPCAFYSFHGTLWLRFHFQPEGARAGLEGWVGGWEGHNGKGVRSRPSLPPI